jgi:acyl-[acyl carrier protein]--UDP-N-acetylglucosamine O-acyltransferase
MPDAGIHATAIVSSEADVAPDVEIGPFSVIEAGARISAGTRIGPHCMIGGHVHLAEACELLSHVAHIPLRLAGSPATRPQICR